MIFSEFLKLRMRQLFSISSRRWVGAKSLRSLNCNVHLWRALFKRDSYEAVWSQSAQLSASFLTIPSVCIEKLKFSSILVC